MTPLRVALVALALLAAALAGCVAPANEVDVAPAGTDAQAFALSPVVHDTLERVTLTTESSLDGEPLRVDVYKPEGDGPFPTILVLSPYWAFAGDRKAAESPTWYIDYFAPRGYAVALAEMRGTRDSGGCWDFGGEKDRQDGYDFVEFLAGQAWSNGKVGMLGQSHVGMSQVATAVTAPPHLTTIVPIAAVTDWYRYLHKDGAPYVLNRLTPPAYFAVHASPSTESVSPEWALTQAKTACDENAVHLAESADVDGDKDAYWQARDLIARAGNTTASVFLVHGFLDENVKTDHFLDYWNALPDTVEKKAWFGQWRHEHPPFKEWREDLHRWFDHWLLGMENGILDGPRVTVQANTEDARTEADWPSAGTRATAWALDGDALVADAAGSGTGRVTFTSVPGDDRGYGRLPGVPNRVAFTTGALDAPLHVAGEPALMIEGTLDAPTGRWIAVLYDEAPDGSRDEVTRAYLDARHRHGLAAGEDVPVGEAVEYALRFYPRDHVVPAGHALVLELVGGDMGCQAGGGTCEGTGVLPVDRVVTHVVATGEGSATRLLLPVVPADAAGPARDLTPLEEWLDDAPE